MTTANEQVGGELRAKPQASSRTSSATLKDRAFHDKGGINDLKKAGTISNQNMKDNAA
jgi:hypothetical protein